MTIKLGVVMDPISAINPKKDSTLVMLLEAQRRHWQIHYMEPNDLFLKDGNVFGRMRTLRVHDDLSHWHDFMDEQTLPLGQLDVVLMRKDPPVGMEYIYLTYLLELAEQTGTFVVNKAQSLRDVNEKMFISWFPQCCPPTLVTSDHARIKDFLGEYGDIICKPLAEMGGASVFRIKQDDPNLNVILETLTHHGKQKIMSQRFIPEVFQGDKRILLVNGKPFPHALARIPAPGETRANLATGGTGVGMNLTPRDHWICEQVGPTLKAKGLLFVGLDVIGDYLTEINVTSPTCIRELDKIYKANICESLFDAIEQKIK